MKNNLKVLAIVIAIIMMVGINVKAEDLYSYGSEMNITIPIHKTDSNNKPLEGVEFTLTDFNNKISYKSEDKKDGDYLINAKTNSAIIAREDVDHEYRIDDHTTNDEVLTQILDIIPTKYSDVFRKAESKEDLLDMLDLPLKVFYENNNNYEVGFYIPLKIEETKVPDGYKAKNIVIPAYVYIGIDNYNDSIYVYSGILATPGYWNYYPFQGVPAYYEYKDGTDYEKIFDEINTELKDFDSEENSMEKLIKIFEDNGAIINKDCDLEPAPTPTPELNREDIEERFSGEVGDYYCPINLIDEKEDIKVNPETYGTFALVLVLAITAGGFTIYRKNKKEA